MRHINHSAEAHMDLTDLHLPIHLTGNDAETYLIAADQTLIPLSHSWAATQNLETTAADPRGGGGCKLNNPYAAQDLITEDGA